MALQKRQERFLDLAESEGLVRFLNGLEKDGRHDDHLGITSKLHAELTRQATAHGSTVEAYATTLLKEALCLSKAVFDRTHAQAAPAHICELRKGVMLGGLTIRELVNERRR